MHTQLPFVAHSHLRWNFVYQRPQHVLSRIAARRLVVYVEEPIPKAGAANWSLEEVAPNVLRCTPHLADRGSPELVPLLERMLSSLRVKQHVAWTYTPTAVPVIRALGPELTIYDCMDELSAFFDAPPGLQEQERELLALAQVVFTGGRSLYRAKRDLHANVHCLPSSVDAAHFRRARGSGLVEPESQRGLPHPRLGFFGVLDERLDRQLLADLADARPEWQIVLVGPVVKIDPLSLPRRANIHYLGQRDYADLPAFLAGWDVCLMPFALNAATLFISPTKTLEYMAAERPIVSTPIRDVVDSYAEIVHVADGSEAFIAACERALREPPRVSAMRAVVAATSWETTVSRMEEEIEEAMALRAGNP